MVYDTKIVQRKFTSKYKSIIAFGRAHIITSKEKITALKVLINKYSPDFTDEGMKYVTNEAWGTTVVRIDIEHIKGKSGH